MKRTRWWWFSWVAPAALVIALAAMTWLTPLGAASDPVPSAPAAATEIASACQLGLMKWADPSTVVLGGTTDITSIVTHTCPSVPLPVDMVIVADESFSMTKAGAGGLDDDPTEPSEPGTPDPSREPPTPGPPAIGTPGSGPGDQGREPPFCGGSGDHPTLEPTATATRRRWRTPTPAPYPSSRPTEVQEYGGSEDQVRAVQQWVRDFVGQREIEADMASGRLKIGFVSFSRRVRAQENLTSNPAEIASAAARLRGGDITMPQTAFRQAATIMDGSGSRAALGKDGRIKVIIVLSDFQFCARDVGKIANDTTFMAVGFGVRPFDRDKVARTASSRSYAFEKANASKVVEVYARDFASGVRPVTLSKLTVSDELDERLSLLPTSVQPPTVTLNGQLVEWVFEPPTSPITLGLTVEPLASGVITVSRSAKVDWTDSLGRLGSAPFPEVAIDVLVHTPTPTATNTPTATATATFIPTSTDTPTATPTPLPKPAYLPITFNVWPPQPTATPTTKPCKPEEQMVDVVLAIDTSDSMKDPTQPGGAIKLDAAINAAIGLVDVLKSIDQIGIVGFNKDATVQQTLTNDKAAATSSLHALWTIQASGTAIDKGLRASLDELSSSRRRPGVRGAIVLLTDGRQTDLAGDEAVRAAAIDIRAAGIVLVTIGLGSDVDETLLREIAYRPDLYYAAPRAEDLVAIYKELAQYIACP